MLRRPLSILALAALTGTALLVPSAAVAAPGSWSSAHDSRQAGARRAHDGDLSWKVENGTVSMTSATRGTVRFVYTCGSTGSTTQKDVSPALFQPTYAEPRADAYDVEGHYPTFVCDGTERQAGWPFKALDGRFANGPAQVGLKILDNDHRPTFEDVRVRGIPRPAPVHLTTDARPERVKKGRTVTVVGELTRDKKGYGRKKVDLQLKTGHSFHTVKTITSTSSGHLSTKVKATTSGSFRYVYRGDSTTKAGTSGSDHIVVTR